ncbi:MAG: HPP family protein [Mariprofundales bacterium]|nr:HPP family protein [Mariprofundales bacterium]
MPTKLRRAAIQGGASFVALSLIWLLHHALIPSSDVPLLMAAFGASAILLYGAPQSAMAQPWSIFVGTILSAVIGVAMGLLPLPLWLVESLAVACSIMTMNITGSLHPPAGAVAFLGASGAFSALGFGFVLCPALTGATIMFCVAMIAHRLQPDVTYPLSWRRTSD